jgi:tRNA A-37 threonylcarbamoyl transferase component Bud32
MRWEIEPEFSPTDDPVAPFPLGQRDEILRTLPGREVFRTVQPDGTAFIVKAFRPRRWFDHLRDVILPSPARRERNRARIAQNLGIPAPRPVALAERKHLGRLRESLYVMESVEGELLSAWIARSSSRSGDRRKAGVALAAFLRDLHHRGVVHEDLHPGNLMLQREGDAYRYFLLDLGAVRFRRTLRRRDRLGALIQLNLFFFQRATKAERMRFLRQYLGPGVRRDERRAWAAAVEKKTGSAAHRFWRKVSKRCVGENKYFTRYRGFGFRGFRRRGAPWPAPGDDPSRPFTAEGTRVIKDSAGALSVLFTGEAAGGGSGFWEGEGEGGTVYGKLFRAASLWEDLRHRWLPSGALRTWRRAFALEVRGVPTPRPLMAVVRRGGLRRGISLFFSEGVPQGVCLDRYCRACREGGREGGARLRALIPGLGRLVGSLHRHRYSHRDLKAGNLLVLEGFPPALLLTDLDGLRGVHRLTRKRREKDLARLFRSLRGDCGFTWIDWIRFLGAYGHAAGLGAGAVREWNAGVVRRAERDGAKGGGS